MTASERISKIKILLGLETAPAPTPVTPAKLSYTLADGTEVEVSELAIGGIVTVAGAPAPAGEHTLSDGTKIVVDEMGVITELTPATATPAPVDLNAERFAKIELAQIEQSKMIAAFDAALKSNTEVVSQLLDIVDRLAKAPTADPATTPAQNFATQEPVNKSEKFENLKKAINNLKK